MLSRLLLAGALACGALTIASIALATRTPASAGPAIVESAFVEPAHVNAPAAGAAHCTKAKKRFPGEYYDPWSHETLSNPPGKTPEKSDAPKDMPLMLGTVRLIEVGVTRFQEAAYRLAMYQFTRKRCPPAVEVSIDVDGVNTLRQANGDWVVKFRVRMDRSAVYRASLQLIGLARIRLTLHRPGSTAAVYRSAVLGAP